VSTQVALLRGINLARTRRIPMARLREVLAERGHQDVRTLLQSGNVVLESDEEPAALAARLATEIEEEFGFEVPVVARTAEELAAVVAADPLGDVATDPTRYLVTFLSAEPEAVPETDVAPERFVIVGREAYSWHPEGLQRSRLAALLTDRTLGVTATARNWNTVTKLLALAELR
jgi:uncharacterized protein (DUF1697 family)